MKPKVLPFKAVLLLVLFAASLPQLLASPPTLAPTARDTNGDFRFHLQGEADTHYLLEQSENMVDWEAAAWGVAPTNGVMEWPLAAETEVPAMFFRARVESPEQIPASVSPVTDPNLSVEGMADELGGELMLLDHDGTIYRLTIPSNAVPEAVSLRMTLVTNLTGYPLDAGEQRSIVFEPKGFEFDVPATLIITFPAETSLSNHVSFWFDSDGADFGLIPDQVSSNAISMPVYHFSGYGSGKASSANLDSQGNRRVGDAFQQLNQQVAVEIAQARRAGKVGPYSTQLPGDLEVGISKATANLIQRQFLRKSGKLSSDCASLGGNLGRMGWILDMGARYGLTSQVYKDAADQLRTAACAGIYNCEGQYLAECNKGDATAYRRYVKLENRRQVTLGATCATPPNVVAFSQSDFDRCRPGWAGFAWNAHTQTSGSTNKQPFSEVLTYEILHWNYKGEVVQVDDQREAAGTPYGVFTVNFSGILTADYHSINSSIIWGCEGETSRSSGRSEVLSQVSSTLKANVNVDLLIIISPVSTNVFLTQSPDVSMPRSSKDYMLETDCHGKLLRQVSTEKALEPVIIQLDLLFNPEPKFNLSPNNVNGFWEPNQPPSGSHSFWSFHIEKRASP